MSNEKKLSSITIDIATNGFTVRCNFGGATPWEDMPFNVYTSLNKMMKDIKDTLKPDTK